MPNRLSRETSPYLLQHKDDPVDWYPWSDAAFDEARTSDKPVFLSIGYSSCHWCHVMAHESFQDEETAAALNRYFVSIKVDREEMPDVDDAYMTAVQLATGHGGWPISVFMTPDKKPFYAGTYFPRDSRGDFPGFRTLVTSLGQSWESQKGEMAEAASKFSATLAAYLTQAAGPLQPSLGLDLIDASVAALHQEFDFEKGGFGVRPKFPPHATVRYLIEYAAKRHLLSGGDEPQATSLSEQAGHMALMTLEEMALGGIHDHVGGGFHRYSTDELWRLPHFEKMVTDNAQMVELYMRAAESTGDARLKAMFERVAERAAEWLLSMRSDDGLFYTALDADSEGEEGLFYTWTVDEVAEVLGDRAETFCQAFGVDKDGNFVDEATGGRSGRNVLYLDQDVEGHFDDDLAELADARSKRVPPMTDDKAIAAVNALVIGAFAKSGRVEEAAKCADVWVERGVPHQITKGEAKGAGFLDDHVYLANALMDLFDATEDHKWRGAAIETMRKADSLFRDGDRYYFTSTEHEVLFGRSVPALDFSVPSALADAARAKFRLGEFDDARAVLLASAGWMQRTARAAHGLMLALFEDLVAFPKADRSITIEKREVGLRLEPSEATVDNEGWATINLVLEIPEGMHVNSNDPTAKWLTPLSLHVEGVFGEASFPTADGEVYRGTTVVPVRLKPKNKSAEFQLRVRYQPCTESECLLPQEALLSGTVLVP
ncbi:MAG TPA: DUF255 domain-containing protein [Fimbriimonadaceae bacterium]|nr:DUF255 domain-containing protein [Fimbriimonadaceae bacterium]